MQARLHVDDLFIDLRDGKMLMKLLEIISGENLGRPNKGVLRVQKMENLNRCLMFLSTKVRVCMHVIVHSCICLCVGIMCATSMDAPDVLISETNFNKCSVLYSSILAVS